MHVFTETVSIKAPPPKVMAVFGNWDLWFVGMNTTKYTATPAVVGTVRESIRLLMGLFIAMTGQVESYIFNNDGCSMRISFKGDESGYLQCNFGFKPNGVDLTLEHGSSMDEKWMKMVSNEFINEAILTKMVDKADADSLENIKLICES
jgi:hypothetical protein